MTLTLAIGDKRISSWSLRPWLALKQTSIPFTEVVVPLRVPDTPALVRKYSPSGKLPALVDGPVTVWDSLSVCEYLAEKFPDKHLWPADAAARSLARSICAEMHAGFPNLRNQFWFNAVGEMTNAEPTTDTAREIARIEQLWGDARLRFGKGGAFLFGAFTNADAFYAPVVSRLRTYGVKLGREGREYCDMISALPAMMEWTEGAKREIG